MTFENYLYESFKTKHIEPRITAIIPRFYEHFLKFWYCKDRDAEKHWIIEMTNFINIITRANDLKTAKGALSYDNSIRMFSRAYSDRNIINAFKSLRRKGYEFVKFDMDAAITNIKSLFDKLWRDIDENKFDFDEFFDEIEKYKMKEPK